MQHHVIIELQSLKGSLCRISAIQIKKLFLTLKVKSKIVIFYKIKEILELDNKAYMCLFM